MKNFNFKIFNSTWKVYFVNCLETDSLDLNSEEFRFGETDYEHNIIRIATKDSKGEPLSLDTIKITTYHEIIHAILFSGQYIEYSNDEPLVEWLANCIYSLNTQCKL